MSLYPIALAGKEFVRIGVGELSIVIPRQKCQGFRADFCYPFSVSGCMENTESAAWLVSGLSSLPLPAGAEGSYVELPGAHCEAADPISLALSLPCAPCQHPGGSIPA